MTIFESSFEYKIIYIFEIRDEAHKGLLKIGDSTLKTDEPIDILTPNSKLINKAAMDRIKQYTNTAGIVPVLLHTELAVKLIKNKDGDITVKAFRDHHVHKVLENSNINKMTIKDSTSREWFKIDLNTAVKAIDAVKKNQNNLSNSTRENIAPIVFRPEQQEAIDLTIKQFQVGNKMLWNAKMRFGKTLSALEVIRKSNFKKSIIITHRPVVDNGWYDDFTKIFNNNDDYVYGSRNSGYNVEQLEKLNKNYVYFASMQDLRGSGTVGGKYDKNNIVFKLNWDFVIIDEAHEGTTTALGDEVIKSIVKENSGFDTKFLALSGTPFNILRNYDDKSIYTWDYIMEQTQKKTWDKLHFGDSNPYEELPELKIFTYSLEKIIGNGNYDDIEDKAFNFREFFRTWTGDEEIDRKPLPNGVLVGDFYHEDDVESFLNLITKDDNKSNYPYSKKEYRDLFKHSLWMVPGVREARALSKLMKRHPVFGMGFDIVNVAGEGDDDVKSDDALRMVQKAIKNASNHSYTITLSCGKLTTGVTVPEWTSVMMLSGSFSTSAANYLQTIFRVQSPCNVDGKIKTSSYVFDFAPDRTLKMIAESVAISTKAGKTTADDRTILGQFLNYCPVISIDGTTMKPYNANGLLQQLKRAYAERAVQNGFDDITLYNDDLLKLDGVEIGEFENLKEIIGSSKASQKINEIDINNQGFTAEEYEEKERIERKPKKERTQEEQELLDEYKKKKETQKTAISILRGISIRMPLLIYGANVPLTEDITINKFSELVDDSSWKEFMPVGVTKEIFNSFTKYYDPEIFISAGRKIRNIVKSADEMEPTERVKKISKLLSCFKNPDKETVLTPWKTVNMHLSDCIGGYMFFDENNEFPIEIPKFINRGTVTDEIFKNPNTKILEINSKTGLYPLYSAYSIYALQCKKYDKAALTSDLLEDLWKKTMENNIFIICKTPMAKSITIRTLVGFKNTKVNVHYFDDLLNMLQNKTKQFAERVLKPDYWKMKGSNKMKFNAIVGNPPYQIRNSENEDQQNASAIYNYFVDAAKKLNPDYISMIMPSRWMTGGRGLDDFRKNMLKNNDIISLHDYVNARDCFANVEIKGGICYLLQSNNYSGKCNYFLHGEDGVFESKRYLDELNLGFVIRDLKAMSIIKKVIYSKNFESFSKIAGSQTPFGIVTSFKDYKDQQDVKYSMKIYGNKFIGYTKPEYIKKNVELANKYKVFVPKAVGSGVIETDVIKPICPTVPSICTQTYIIYGSFDNSIEQKNLATYMKTKFFHYMLGQLKNTQQMAPNLFALVPMQNFTDNSDINWSQNLINVDEQLFKKYNLNQEEITLIREKLTNIY